ncbi:MAG TPA: diguanylate cyclase [Mizugakiibacter sp.]
MGNPWTRRLAAVALLLLAAAVRAEPAPELQIATLPAEAGSPPSAAVISGAYADAFRPLVQPLLRGGQQHALWYRVQLGADWSGASAPLLVVSGAVRTGLVAYLPPHYAPRAVTPYDADLDPRFSRHALVFELPRNLRAQQPMYLRVGMPAQSQPLRLRIADYGTYQAEDLDHVRISAAISATQAAMLAVILCFWIVLRDRVFLYFLGYAGFQVIYQMAASGELYALPGTGALAPLGYHPGQFAAVMAALLSVNFIIEFADLRRTVPWMARLLGWARWPYAALAAAVWLPPLHPDAWLPNTVNGMLAITTPLALLAAWRAWRRGSRQAGFFLISWLPLLALTVLRVLQLIVGLPLPAWLAYGFPFSMAYAAVVITVGLADRTLQARRERDQAHRLAEYDPLTGVLNRRAVLTRLRVAYADARQSRRPLGLLFLDLDHFKRINDSHGHAAGDDCLIAVAGAIQAELRELDWLGRYGGEEFLVVLPDAAALTARIVAERIRLRATELRVAADGEELHLTVSIGIALLDDATPTPEALIEHADIALYRAKAQGRNRVVQYLPGEVIDAATLARHG